MTTRTRKHEAQELKLKEDIARYLESGGVISEHAPEETNERWLKSIDKVVRDRGEKQTKADKFNFNGPVRVPRVRED